ncbi:hypothetical protein [Minwuia thermotolerans]|uniref:hypothetical protein n=1 Tax=Minwuia thermotolerans TaxID=2056226 RepID=UPI000F63131D|nr:hypothetical protein [Minwuia thermotolerans]
MAQRLADEFVQRINKNIENIAEFCRTLDPPIRRIQGEFDGGSDEGTAFLSEDLNFIQGTIEFANATEGPSGLINVSIESLAFPDAVSKVFTDVGFWLHKEHGFGTGDIGIHGQITWWIKKIDCLFEFSQKKCTSTTLFFQHEEVGFDEETPLYSEAIDYACPERAIKYYMAAEPKWLTFSFPILLQALGVDLKIKLDHRSIPLDKYKTFRRNKRQYYVWNYNIGLSSLMQFLEFLKKKENGARKLEIYNMERAISFAKNFKESTHLQTGTLEIRYSVGPDGPSMCIRTPRKWAEHVGTVEGEIEFESSLEDHDVMTFERIE